jgi:hypothetical protein
MDTSAVIMIIVLLTLVIIIVFLLLRIKTPIIYRKGFRNHYDNQKHYYMNDFYDEAYSLITKTEIELRIKLSNEAKQLLILPLIEVLKIEDGRKDSFRYRNYKYYEFENWRKSIVLLMESIKYEPARIDRTEENYELSKRSSISVIKAFSKKFCNIPPFCGEK